MLTNPEPNSTGAAPVVHNPELVFGLVGPIGVNIDEVTKTLSESLSQVKYSPVLIHLTDHIDHPELTTQVDSTSYYKKYMSLIEKGNEFRKWARSPSAFAGVAIGQIRAVRDSLTGDSNTPKNGTAYIIRQFKRPEEIEVMRQVYGRKFIQISIYGGSQNRHDILQRKIRSYDTSPKDDLECSKQAMELISIDQNQTNETNGQRLSQVFYLGDVFVDGVNIQVMQKTLERFVNALFGSNSASPTKDEHGLYLAAAASLRSADVARQVGAAICTKDGEVISLGCNEVPKANGGNYWSDDPPPIHRDVEKGNDPNSDRRAELVHDLLARLNDKGLLSFADGKSWGNEWIKEVLSEPEIQESQVMDIIEFGRINHAEMSAIMDAARLGHSTKGNTLFCTTFPCHMCAKHIVAAGITRVVFLEPYPKSYAIRLHNDAITFDKSVSGKVLFEPFMGISPRRYRDIFEKRSRKKGGVIQDWYLERPTPMIEDRTAAYIKHETSQIVITFMAR